MPDRRVRRARARWKRFWFEPAAPVNLGICRWLFFGALLLLYRRRDFSAWAEVSDAFWMPIWLFETLHLPALSADALATLQLSWRLALALSCVGLFTRFSTAFAFLLGLYLLGLPHNFGHQHHSDALVVIVLAIMALSRCGDGWSVDRALSRARRGSGPAAKLSMRSGEYTWPVRAVWLMLALVFFAAGMSKLRNSGVDWILSDNLAIMMIQKNYYDSPLTSWGLNLAQVGWLSRLLAAATVVFEVGYPLALFSTRARWIIVPAVLLIQMGIRVVMGPSFYPFMICNVFWVRWDLMGRRLLEGFRRPPLPAPQISRA
jgi:uncharacterized membrane protein YphA (DoxX/SURF4 family)